MKKKWFDYAYTYSIVSILSPAIMIVYTLFAILLSLLSWVLMNTNSVDSYANATNFVPITIFFVLAVILFFFGILGFIGNLVIIKSKKLKPTPKENRGITLSVIGTSLHVLIVFIIYTIGRVLSSIRI